MHSDCCLGPVQVLVAFAVLFLRILCLWPFFLRPITRTRITWSNTREAMRHRRTSGNSLFAPKFNRKRRYHFVLNDAVDPPTRSHLRRSLCCRSFCEAHVVLSLILRHQPRDYPHEAVAETNHRAAEKRRRCEALTEPLANHRGVVRIMRRSLYSLCRFPSPLSSPLFCSQPLSHSSSPLPLYFPQYFCFTRSSLFLLTPFRFLFFHFLRTSFFVHFNPDR